MDKWQQLVHSSTTCRRSSTNEEGKVFARWRVPSEDGGEWGALAGSSLSNSLIQQCAILQAARDGDLTLVKKRLKASIFKKGEDVNKRDDRECTALHYAAKTSNIAIASLLLAKGADLTAEDKHGWSVLHYAVRYGSEAMVQFLVERGADIHCKEKRGWGVLHLAARNGHSDKARLLLENGVSVSESQRQGWNSLHLAVRYGFNIFGKSLSTFVFSGMASRTRSARCSSMGSTSTLRMLDGRLFTLPL